MHGPWKAGGIAVLLTLVSVSLAYRVPAVLELDLGRSFPSGLTIDNFHDPEQGYRWTRAQSRIVFRDPGTSPDVRVEVDLAGFRPPGRSTPLLVLDAAGASASIEPTRRVATYSVQTRTSGWWSSDVEIQLRSETFTPGDGDERALGVRVHRARLSLPAGALPPLRQLLSSLLIIGLGLVPFWRAAPASQPRGRVGWLAPIVAAALGLGFAVARPVATLVVPAVAAALVALTLTRMFIPALARLAQDAVAATTRELAEGVRTLTRRRTLALVGAAVGIVWASYRFTPIVELDLGSGATQAVARRFGALDRDGDVTFQRVRAGASLDLRDFGTNGPWKITVHAATRGERRQGVLLRSADTELIADVAPTWNAYELEIPAPAFGWRGGRLLQFPGLGAGTQLLVDRVVIDRGHSGAGLRVTALVLGIVLLFSAALRSSVAGYTLLAVIAAALSREPVLAIPFLPTVLLGIGAAFVLSAATRGVLAVAAEHSLLPELSPAAVSAALAGFVVWFVAIASPAYVGGHYGFHTNIAEEIWQGQFWRYFLPYPGSMLSRQPQWENLVIPHSCLFHTLISPLTALPRPWSHDTIKLVLASLLFTISVSCALVATRLGGARAGIYAAVASAFVPTGAQLLGLGHLMTLFGTWASTLALGFLILQAESLSKRSIFAGVLALLVVCFVSYTGSLLFASLALVAACAVLLKESSQASAALGKRLASALVIAWTGAFLLYYIYWALPFVRDSLPALLTGSGSDTGIDVWARIASQPRKLAYTFGSWLVPLVGLAGLALASGARRVLLASWGGILIAFSGLDVVFNFLLKHHYFTYPVVAIGVGLALERLHEKNWLTRVIAAIAVVLIVWMGVHEANAVGRGAS